MLKLENVSASYGSVPAISNVSIDIGEGDAVGLLGANGAGKTTLIRMLLGLLQVSEGEVRLFGEPPSRRTRQRIGYLPQTLGLYDDLTAAENVAAAARWSERPGGTPAELLALVG